MQQKMLTKEQALQKLRHYCAYQERCHSEVKKKLFELGVRKPDHDEIVSALIEDGYLNEERFAAAFAGGKFRMMQWGRRKILNELQQKGISEFCIRKAMKEIDQNQYLETLSELAGRKYEMLKGEQYLVRKKKTFDYLLQKGFEPDLINKSLNELIKNKTRD